MLSFSVIGCGAAGNKAVIDLMNIGYNPDKVFMLNSTYKDIPSEYHSKMMIFGARNNRLGGCGKERSIGRDMLLSDIKSGAIDLDSIVDPNDQAIVLVGATEGGSGSASIPILAKYFKKVHNKNVICVLFFGFNDDVRGIKNSIDICKELSEDYTVIGISNERFLVGNNKFSAERAANGLFCDIIKVCTGATITPGTQVIDDTDLYKVVTTPGYMIVNSFEFSTRPKNIAHYHELFNPAIDSQEFVDPGENPGAKRIAMIFDIPNDTDAVDFSGKKLRENYGEPYEFFTHVNNDAGAYRVSIIVSGMKLPSEELQYMYNTYLDRTSRVNKSRDDFFDIVGGMDGFDEDKGFDMLTSSEVKNTATAKSSFFEEYETDTPAKPVTVDRTNFEY